MQLGSLIIEPRIRSPWSAADLGIMLGKKFWIRGVALYLILAIPVFILCRSLIEFGGWVPYLILWWLKPIFERPLLFSLSRELFGNPTSFQDTIRQYRQWLTPSFLSIITLRRLSTNRGMYAPVSLLERPNSSQYSSRVKTLGLTYSNASTWTTVVLYHIESFIALALLALLAFFFPDSIDNSLAWMTNDMSENNVFMDLSFVLIMAAVAPFYCAGGFMLYISRRIELEGWDIEICFREWMANSTSTKEVK